MNELLPRAGHAPRILAVLHRAAEVLLSYDDPADAAQVIFGEIAGDFDLDVYCNFMVAEDGKGLVLHSCAGIDPQEKAGLASLAYGQTVCGMVAERGRAMIIPDVQRSDSPLVEIIKASGVKAYVGLPLWAKGRLLGVLSFGSRSRISFTEEEVEALRTICHYVASAHERAWLCAELDRRVGELAHALEEKEAALRRKDLLAKEVDHRVKNSLQLVSSLLEMHRLDLGDSEAGQKLADAGRLVHAVAQVHRRLYRSEDVAVVDIGLYLRDLCDDLSRSVGEEYTVTVDASCERVATDKVVSIGLIVTELVLNACKHAFVGSQGGTICVSFASAGGEARLSVSDDGIGLPEDGKGGSGLGMKIVRALTRQLDGSLFVEKPARGCRYEITLPL
ncbi:histidine kinase dimerization/phosphoacceptor domain -containing protein [Telmatospirillum sp. J64-1]|uniref:histidine kinase dimerization/phosphoacceptor domain -containing protein n=1 Tax=Telmatospirillum sp. J64-1 TaxID=2502183 RepID=UPI00163D54D0|nr:histidine kinase dimerization/phosphoacceptor domain -containing protein [Telmatospirillum sp. J64-1]